MEFSFLCSNDERKVYENSIGKEVTISINGLQSNGIVKAVTDFGNVIVETDNEIGDLLKQKLGI